MIRRCMGGLRFTDLDTPARFASLCAQDVDVIVAYRPIGKGEITHNASWPYRRRENPFPPYLSPELRESPWLPADTDRREAR